MAEKRGASPRPSLAVGTEIEMGSGMKIATWAWLQKRRKESEDVLAELHEKIPARIGRLAAAVDAGKEAYQEEEQNNGNG